MFTPFLLCLNFHHEGYHLQAALSLLLGGGWAVADLSMASAAFTTHLGLRFEEGTSAMVFSLNLSFLFSFFSVQVGTLDMVQTFPVGG